MQVEIEKRILLRRKGTVNRLLKNNSLYKCVHLGKNVLIKREKEEKKGNDLKKKMATDARQNPLE